MMGVKAAQKIYSLGSKLALMHSLGKKLGRLGQQANHDLKGSSVSKELGVNNMIYNKSKLGDAQYLPFGIKKLVGEPKKKSYLEKQ